MTWMRFLGGEGTAPRSLERSVAQKFLRENMSFEAQKIFAARKFDADLCVYFMTRRACFGWLSICSPRLSLFMPGSRTLLELDFGGQGLLKGPVSFGTFRPDWITPTNL